MRALRLTGNPKKGKPSKAWRGWLRALLAGPIGMIAAMGTAQLRAMETRDIAALDSADFAALSSQPRAARGSFGPHGVSGACVGCGPLRGCS